MKQLKLCLILGLVAFVFCGCSTSGKSFQEGVHYYQNQDYIAAEKAFRQAVSQGTKDGEVYASLALTQEKLGNTEEAGKNLEKALEMSSDNHEVLRLAGIISLSSGEYEKAADYFSNAVSSSLDKISKKDYDTFAYLADTKSKLGDDDGAIEIYTKLIENKYALIDLCTKRGMIYVNRGDKDLAVADFDQAVSLGATRFQQLEISDLFWNSGEYELGTKYRNGAFKVTTGTDEEKIQIAKLYCKRGYYDQAIDTFLTVSGLDEDARLVQAYCYMMVGKWSVAEGYYDDLLLLTKNPGKVYNQYAMSKILQGDYSSASRLLEQGKIYENSVSVSNALCWNDVVIKEKSFDYLGAYQALLSMNSTMGITEAQKKELLFLNSR